MASGGVQLKWLPPPEVRQPDKPWRLYVFKPGAGEDPIDTLHLHRQPSFLFGRDRAVADIPVDHASASKQHAVLCFRLVEQPREPGDMGPARHAVRPYVIDLEATNGTFLNGRRLAPARCVASGARAPHCEPPRVQCLPPCCGRSPSPAPHAHGAHPPSLTLPHSCSYVELRSQDVLRFGESTREFVLVAPQ